MRIVVVGSGGREHALQWHMARFGHEVAVTPGNGGIPGSTSMPAEELEADLFVVGPEKPLVEGLADRLRAQGKTVFGPGADGAKLEGSKIWMKQLFDAAGLPTAKWEHFDGPSGVHAAEHYLRYMNPPYVIKADGLAAGKGVTVTRDLDEAIVDARNKLRGQTFGDAGRRIVIEEGLDGREVSFFAICGGQKNWVQLPSAHDYKRLLDGDKGPNTGGMGAYFDFEDDDLEVYQFVDLTLSHLAKLGIDYRGVLYGGLMLTADGPKILEYNVRFGDPETQAILPCLQSDLALEMLRASKGEPLQGNASTSSCVTVVLAAEGYPEEPRKGQLISGLNTAEAYDDVKVFHGATKHDAKRHLRTAGGRVLSISATGETLKQARLLAYGAIKSIHFDGMQYRTDIGLK